MPKNYAKYLRMRFHFGEELYKVSKIITKILEIAIRKVFQTAYIYIESIKKDWGGKIRLSWKAQFRKCEFQI